MCASAADILNVASTVLNVITEPLEDALNELLEPIMDKLKKLFPSKKLRYYHNTKSDVASRKRHKKENK